MCTAISYKGSAHFFGRNLDLEYYYQEQVVIAPRNYPFRFRCGYALHRHYAMIGMATVANGYPLYYEATNECGLSIAGLHFPGSAVYQNKAAGKDNLAPYEIIPWILGQCKSVKEAKKLLGRLSIWALPFSREFPLSPLHYMLCDAEQALVIEPLADGLKIYENPVGVLTNEPPFPYHMHHLADFMQLHPGQAQNQFPGIEIKPYSNGMGAMGLPGDFSSASRFVKAAYVLSNSVTSGSEISQFFHMLNAVAMPKGCVRIGQANEITRYSSCCDTQKGIYYYTTYENSRPRAVCMHNTNLEASVLTAFDLLVQPDIYYQN